jgi:hypothetical protein
VQVRVEDTNHAPGTLVNDLLSIDHMFFRSVSLPTPGEASDLRVTGVDAQTGELSLSWTPACEAADHNLIYGPLASVGTYGYTGQVCGVSASSYYGFDPGTGSWFFLVVATDGSSVEGAYGTNTAGDERPEQTDDPACAFVRNLAFRCDAP